VTGYWAHYNTWFAAKDGSLDSVSRDHYPVVGHADGVALIIDEDGTVTSVKELLEALREGGDEGGWTVSLTVDYLPPTEE
jgi:hypothetical protein